jgi:hypothetical protein
VDAAIAKAGYVVPDTLGVTEMANTMFYICVTPDACPASISDYYLMTAKWIKAHFPGRVPKLQFYAVLRWLIHGEDLK